jgi:hypothetical protein
MNGAIQIVLASFVVINSNHIRVWFVSEWSLLRVKGAVKEIFARFVSILVQFFFGLMLISVKNEG